MPRPSLASDWTPVASGEKLPLLVKMPTSSRVMCIRWCNCRIFVVKWLLIPRASGGDLLALLASQGRQHSTGHKQDLPVQPTSWKAEVRLKMGATDSDNSFSSSLSVSSHHLLFTLRSLIAEPQDATNRLKTILILRETSTWIYFESMCDTLFSLSAAIWMNFSE